MIKAILFDFDGVLTLDKTGSASIVNYISTKCNLPLDIVKTSYYKHNKALLNGTIVHKDMWSTFCNDIGQSIPYNILTESFKTTKIDEQMISFVKELKEKYLVAMITDNKCDRMNTIVKMNKLSTYFDFIAVSASLHMNKGSQDIFDYTIKQLNVSANECAFINNTEKNLFVPTEMGMKTILFDDENRNFKGFKNKLDNLLLRA